MAKKRLILYKAPFFLGKLCFSLMVNIVLQKTRSLFLLTQKSAAKCTKVQHQTNGHACHKSTFFVSYMYYSGQVYLFPTKLFDNVYPLSIPVLWYWRVVSSQMLSKGYTFESQLPKALRILRVGNCEC